MKRQTVGNFNLLKGSDPKIMVIADAPHEAVFDRGDVMTNPALRLFGKHAKDLGFTENDFIFVTPCPNIPEVDQSSESRTGAFIAQFHDEFKRTVGENMDGIRAVVCMGKAGNRQMVNKAIQITKCRGAFTTRAITGNVPVLPVFSPNHVLTRPENEDIFAADLRRLRSLADQGWNMNAFDNSNSTVGYRWCFDISHLLLNPPKAITIDCETVGLEWFKPGFRVLTISITTAPGVSYVMPLNADYWNNPDLKAPDEPTNILTIGQINTMKEQVRELLLNPDIAVVGHNLKYDLHCLRAIGIDMVANWYADTMQLAFAADDNMQSKSLTECTRRWVPALSGYSDEFDEETNKARMDLVPHARMLDYAGGDTDATFQLAKVLLPLVKEDRRNWETFKKVQMPALRAFVRVEQNGVLIDRAELMELELKLDQMEKDAYAELIGMVPPAILRKHEGGWAFSRAAFTCDVLFTKEGLGLKPLVYTKATKKLPKDQRIPSTSAKDHLPFFDEVPFVQKLMAYQKLSKMRGTYVGSEGRATVHPVARTANGSVPARLATLLADRGIALPPSKATRNRIQVLDAPVSFEVNSKRKILIDRYGNIAEVKIDEPSGFWQFLVGWDRIHPSFLLHGTVTGRTSSRGPNAQNFPKRGALAKAFRKIFKASPGYVLLEADLSQAEVRVAAWMANDTELIRIYKAGGDVHSATAATTMGISEEKFLAGRKDETPLHTVANQWPGSGSWLQTYGNNERLALTVAQFCDFKRFQAKALVFGFLYGMGWAGFKRYAKIEYQIEFTEEEAQEMRVKFFGKYRGLLAWHKGMEAFAKNNGYVRGLHGALRRLPSIYSDDDGVQSGAVRQAINSPVQRFASDLGLMALARLVRDADPEMVRPVLFIHDAVVIEAKEEHAAEIAAAIKFYMESPPLKEWFGIEAPFPITSDVSVGPNLGAMEEMKGLEAVAPPWYRRGEAVPDDDPMTADAWRTKKKRGILMTDS